MESQRNGATKRRRATQACDFCRGRSIKCRPQTQYGSPSFAVDLTASCLTCLEYGQDCVRSRLPKKRGTKPRQKRLEHKSLDNPTGEVELNDAIKLQLQQRRKVLTTLLDIYLDTIHPLFPVFCERELWVGWREGTFPENTAEYTCFITMCAVSAQYAQKGALFNDEMSQEEIATCASEYRKDAVLLVPIDYSKMSHLNLMRSYGLLALLGTQIGDSDMVQKYLGLYHGICGRFSLHDERRWPSSIGTCEREVRRRIFWSIYRLEVHTACVLGHYVRVPEAQCDVGYPSGLHHPAFVPGRDGNFEDWFSGWNYTTDLYRILEHAVVAFRTKRRLHTPSMGIIDHAQRGLLSEKLSSLQLALLPQYEKAFLRSDDSGRNRCGFQATNIFCTIHLVRILTSLSDDHDLGSICDTAQEMIDSMRRIPPEYMRACGATLLQQLAGVGHMLCIVAAKEKLSTFFLQKLRLILGSIVDFLDMTKQHHEPVVMATFRLRQHLSQLESAHGTLEGGSEHYPGGFELRIESHEADGRLFDYEDYGTFSDFGHEIFSATFLGDIALPLTSIHRQPSAY
ncbi:hypothetical protein LTR84_003470 [Exophiala bonariae]|uniref:Zn(2)-C6 fungal-type domain-containing protein n=1 Tax=Exophiala bonariae TaxID=1690606 RepID=A0AAV9NAS4_9EURO|nr:hypothetical protein LTR84_003470 [Exophiala bonariae]